MSQNVDHPTETEQRTETEATTDRTKSPIQGRDWDPNKTTRDRVYEVAIQLYEPATTSEVADRADCSTDAARQHLDWLADVGIVARDTTRPTTYCRNESYFEWRRVEGLRREYTREELLDRLEDLTGDEQTYRGRYDAAHPEDVDALEVAEESASTDLSVHEVWQDLSDWRAVRRELRLLERARRAATHETDHGASTDG